MHSNQLLRIVPLLALVLASAAHGQPSRHGHGHERPEWSGWFPPIAHVSGEDLFVLTRPDRKRDSPTTLAVGRLSWRYPQGVPMKLCELSIDFEHEDVVSSVPWHIAHGVIWVVPGEAICRVPLSDWPLHDPSNANRMIDLEKKYGREGFKKVDPQVQSWRGQPFAKPIDHLWRHYDEWRAKKVKSLGLGLKSLSGVINPDAWEEGFGNGIHVDILPEKSDSALLFCAPHWHLAPGNIVVDAWSLSAKWDSERYEWREVELPKKPDFSIELPFDEPFRVFGDRKELFFVTQAGACYSALRGTDGKYKVEQRWKGTRYPIVALVNDTKRNRTFAFTKTPVRRDGDQPFYFELRVPIKPVRYDFPAGDKVDAATLADLAGLLMGKEIQIER